MPNFHVNRLPSADRIPELARDSEMCIRDRCFYGCFALGALYWTLYLLLFDTTPRVFYVSEFGWVASVIFLRILQATLASQDERSFRCRRAWLAPAFGVPLLAFYCTFGDILSNLIWCGMMIWLLMV